MTDMRERSRTGYMQSIHVSINQSSAELANNYDYDKLVGG